MFEVYNRVSLISCGWDNPNDEVFNKLVYYRPNSTSVSHNLHLAKNMTTNSETKKKGATKLNVQHNHQVAILQQHVDLVKLLVVLLAKEYPTSPLRRVGYYKCWWWWWWGGIVRDPSQFTCKILTLFNFF